MVLLSVLKRTFYSDYFSWKCDLRITWNLDASIQNPKNCCLFHLQVSFSLLRIFAWFHWWVCDLTYSGIDVSGYNIPFETWKWGNKWFHLCVNT